MWKPIRSAARSPWMSSLRKGSVRKTSSEGHGVCRNQPTFQKQKTRLFSLFLNVAPPLLPYVQNLIPSSEEISPSASREGASGGSRAPTPAKTKNTFFQSLSKCRTPTFAICPKFNSKKKNRHSGPYASTHGRARCNGSSCWCWWRLHVPYASHATGAHASPPLRAGTCTCRSH